MLKLVDETFGEAARQPSLVEISRHVRLAAEHLSAASDMVERAELDDRSKLQLALFASVAKLAPVITALVTEIGATQRAGRD